ncbi:hypothetical protein GCM10025872_17280 [Barrientosiimonas endolithica]|uniref:Uncharacterized protein n=1 Tax=Barrientosiimonas endolithica TaxID=1535208 RepID=A0ABM8HAV3_9MICO|nr:hypothetical protein GCM10025872_17280 [Barrientosiimonas endolithica]
MSALIAWRVTVSPHEGPMNVEVTLRSETPNSSASAARVLAVAAGEPSPSRSVCTRTSLSPIWVTITLLSLPVTSRTTSLARVS